MYPSDITDKKWAILASFVAQGKMGCPPNMRYEVLSDFCLKKGNATAKVV